ncbi:unnamed protein product [Microthlaspi erraticum]|uniref:GIR1-like zinc ribbon domain-containing protein n=1 Tax=Microthlaspi erraticum TaxID=1685480 RepID=A0A6D2HSJ4_9BRAS|nr:unnamed protein product [Microthlaspi erraticum]
MKNENGKRVRAESPVRSEESVVAGRRCRGRSISSDASSSITSCLSTTEERKEEVASSWVDDDEESPEMVAIGCRRCYMYYLILIERTRCPKCNSKDLIRF